MNNIVITGMGVISTAGKDLDEFWDTLAEGRITYGPVEEYKNNENYRITIGAKIHDPGWEDNLEAGIKERYGKSSQYAVYASLSALNSAGISLKDLPQGRTAICFGSTMGEIQVEEAVSLEKHRNGIEKVPDHLLRQYRTDHITSAVRNALKVTGPAFNLSAACTAGNYAVALARNLLQWGYADIAFAGGVDAFSHVAFSGFQRLLSLAPEKCQPFDKNRKGLVLGEGCGVVVLETEEFARSRRKKGLGTILGIGLTSDSYHMTAPHPEGLGAERAMSSALKESGLALKDIDYISAHGTGTPANDRVEVKALKKIYGEEKIPPTSSIKSMIGHAMGAASALELAASLQMMEKGVILPTVNYSEPDPDCEIDCVPNDAREAKVDCFLSNSFAFGGQVSSIIVRRG